MGANDGPPVTFHWSPPNPLPRLIPWLAILILLVFPRNRTASAWWIWAPLGWALVLRAGMKAMFTFIPSEVLDVFCESLLALAFGMAAVWLLAPQLSSRLRIVAGLKILSVLAVFSIGAYAVTQNWLEMGGQQFAGLIILGITATVVTLALCLAGFANRRKFHTARFWFVVLLGLIVFTMLGLLPFAVVAFLSDGAEVLGVLVIFALVSSGICFVLLTPYLILSFRNGFYRDRISALLRWDNGLPPVISPDASTPLSHPNEKLPL